MCNRASELFPPFVDGDAAFTRDNLPVSGDLLFANGVVATEPELLDLPPMGVSFSVSTDWRQLRSCGFEWCAYGAAGCRMFPFMTSYKALGQTHTARDILHSIGAIGFRSDHGINLDLVEPAFPGRHAISYNDEIHCDFESQGLFDKRYEDADVDSRLYGPIDPLDGVHGRLKRLVVDQRLWYVLLHHYETPPKFEIWTYPRKHRYVLLFAVGLSLNGARLIGCVTCQLCHNYCD